MKFSRFFMIILILVFIIIITGIIRVERKSNNKQDNSINVEEMFDSILDKDSKELEKITVNFNEFPETKKYKVKVEKYEVVEDKLNDADSGYQLVKFHLII